MKLRLVLSMLIALLVVGLTANRPQALTAQPSPISLINPDGQALTLEKYDLRVAIDGPLSLTEMEMVFRNPEKRLMEGRFTYVLPSGATISRFAKEVDGKLMEGEVVEKLRAQAIYTQVLQSMRDPALLELDQGNRFSARVFPIPAGGTVRLVLGFSQVVPVKNGERKISVPLAGLQNIGEFTCSAVVNDVPGQTFNPIAGFDAQDGNAGVKVYRAVVRKNFTPPNDLEMTFKTNATQTRAITAGNYQMLSFTPPVENLDFKEPSRDWNFYFDTSASNAENEKAREAVTEQLFSYLNQHPNSDKSLSVTAFDVAVTPIQSWNRSLKDGAPSYGANGRFLQERHALGATNLEAALKHIGEQARAEQKPQRYVLVSDGIATIGARESRELLATLGDWPERHVLHALVIGNKQDEKTLNAIVEKTHGRVVVLPLTAGYDAQMPRVFEELTTPIGKTYEFYDEAAAWIYPKTFRDVRGGSELVVFSQLKDGGKSKPGVVTRSADGKSLDTTLTTEPKSVPDFAPLLQREATAAYLNQLEQLEQAQSDEVKRAALRKQRVELSEKSRVLCPLTSLLVLESERDYERFGIARTSLADIMTIGEKGIALQHRTAADLPASAAPTATANAKKVRGSGGAKLADSNKEQEKPGAAGIPEDIDPLADRFESVQSDQLKLLTEDGAEQSLEPLHANGFSVETAPVSTPAASAQSGGGQMQSNDVMSVRASHPFRTAGDAAPRPADGAGVAERNARLVVPAEGRTPQAGHAENPEWAKQFDAPPTAEQLNALHAQVAAAPRDRGARNAYADALFAAKKWDELQGQAFEWLPFDPENPQVYEYLGKSATGLGDKELALRAMTSIAEVAPNRAALLARSGWLLLTAQKYEMAEQMFREALKNRKDDANIYRGLALSLWLNENYALAAKELSEAIKLDFDPRYGDVRRVLHEELGYVLRAWAQKEQTAALNFAQLHGAEADMRRSDAFRATLCWETDANDVDLHVVDPNGEDCYYSNMHNVSGLELYSDQTQGLGPEVIRCDKLLPGAYEIGVTYFNAGPMGVSRGVAVIMKPEDGIVKQPQIIPFCLVPQAVGGANIRMVGKITQ